MIKTIERVGMAAVIAAFVAYFCYQVAYGIETTLWPNGTRTRLLSSPDKNVYWCRII